MGTGLCGYEIKWVLVCLGMIWSRYRREWVLACTEMTETKKIKIIQAVHVVGVLLSSFSVHVVGHLLSSFLALKSLCALP